MSTPPKLQYEYGTLYLFIYTNSDAECLSLISFCTALNVFTDPKLLFFDFQCTLCSKKGATFKIKTGTVFFNSVYMGFWNFFRSATETVVFSLLLIVSIILSAHAG